MSDAIVQWDDAVNEVLTGDITAALAYVTPAGGAVVTAVAPCGSADRAEGVVGFTTSLGFGKKLERIVRQPSVALAYHSREHGFSTSAQFVLVQGSATVDLTPSEQRLKAFEPQATRFLGGIKRGAVWDRLLREYYGERVFVDVDVQRIIAWPDLQAAGDPVVVGDALGRPSRPAGSAEERHRPPGRRHGDRRPDRRASPSCPGLSRRRRLPGGRPGRAGRPRRERAPPGRRPWPPAAGRAAGRAPRPLVPAAARRAQHAGAHRLAGRSR